MGQSHIKAKSSPRLWIDVSSICSTAHAVEETTILRVTCILLDSIWCQHLVPMQGIIGGKSTHLLLSSRKSGHLKDISTSCFCTMQTEPHFFAAVKSAFLVFLLLLCRFHSTSFSSSWRFHLFHCFILMYFYGHSSSLPKQRCATRSLSVCMQMDSPALLNCFSLRTLKAPRTLNALDTFFKTMVLGMTA